MMPSPVCAIFGGSGTREGFEDAYVTLGGSEMLLYAKYERSVDCDDMEVFVL